MEMLAERLLDSLKVLLSLTGACNTTLYSWMVRFHVMSLLLRR